MATAQRWHAIAKWFKAQGRDEKALLSCAKQCVLTRGNKYILFVYLWLSTKNTKQLWHPKRVTSMFWKKNIQFWNNIYRIGSAQLIWVFGLLHFGSVCLLSHWDAYTLGTYSIDMNFSILLFLVFGFQHILFFLFSHRVFAPFRLFCKGCSHWCMVGICRNHFLFRKSIVSIVWRLCSCFGSLMHFESVLLVRITNYPNQNYTNPLVKTCLTSVFFMAHSGMLQEGSNLVVKFYGVALMVIPSFCTSCHRPNSNGAIRIWNPFLKDVSKPWQLWHHDFLFPDLEE